MGVAAVGEATVGATAGGMTAAAGAGGAGDSSGTLHAIPAATAAGVSSTPFSVGFGRAAGMSFVFSGVLAFS